MRVKGIAAAAIAALALAGCAQRNQEDVQAQADLSSLLDQQTTLIAQQEELQERLEGRWQPLALSRFIKKELRPETEKPNRQAVAAIGTDTEEAAGEVTQAAADLRASADQVEDMLEGFYSANTAPELINPRGINPNPNPPTDLGPIREDVEAVDAEALELEKKLIRSAEAANEGLITIETALEDTGNLNEQSQARIDGGTDSIRQLEEDAGLASRAFATELEGYLSNILETIEGAQATRLPDGACAEVPVPYPSTLGTPSVYVYIYNGPTCQFGSQLALELFSNSIFRESGSGYKDPPATGPLPDWAESRFMCELGEVSPIGDPRVVLCFPEGRENDWAAPRVAFEAPATAG